MLEPLGLTEFPFRQFAGIAAVVGFDLEEMLADFRVTAIVAQNVLEELHDEVRHEYPPEPRASRNSGAVST
jgi:hypothetical protein